jgi:glycosyltransferase involved in cell wall biosynthesis
MTEKSTPRRVLILTTAYLPQVGGSELAIKNITDRLPGIYFDLITSRSSKNLPEYEKIGAVNVYRVGNSFGLRSFLLPKNFLPIAVFFKACQLIRRYGSYDIIHAYQASQAAGGGWLLRWKYPHVPFIVTVQEGKELNKQSLLTKFFRYLIFRKVDMVTVISDYLAKYVRSQNPKIPVSVIPNGVDLDKFKPISGFDENVVITVSRLVPKNGVKDLVKAMAIVKKDVGDTKLVIVGSGPLEKEIRQLIKDLDIDDRVIMVGSQSLENVADYLSKAKVFVRPSLSEGLGTAFLEAMAVGLPIIGTPVGGIPDFLKDGETGLFCKIGDSGDIADKIIKLLENPELRNKLVNNGRKLVEEKYSWDLIASKFKDIYARI